MSGTEKRGKYYRKVLGPDGYKKMVANRKLLHEKLLRRARVPLHHADMLPEFMRSSIAMPSRSQVRRGNVCHREWVCVSCWSRVWLRQQTYYREIEINHPHNQLTFEHLERPKNLKHLSEEEQRKFKHLDKERPPSPPSVGPCDTVIAAIRMEPPAHVHQPQPTETINLHPRPPAQPGTFVPEKQYPASKGCELYVAGGAAAVGCLSPDLHPCAPPATSTTLGNTNGAG